MRMNPDVSHEDDAAEPRIACDACRARVLSRETVMIGGRALCFACASAWFVDDEESEDSESVT